MSHLTEAISKITAAGADRSALINNRDLLYKMDQMLALYETISRKTMFLGANYKTLLDLRNRLASLSDEKANEVYWDNSSGYQPPGIQIRAEIANFFRNRVSKDGHGNYDSRYFGDLVAVVFAGRRKDVLRKAKENLTSKARVDGRQETMLWNKLEHLSRPFNYNDAEPEVDAEEVHSLKDASLVGAGAGVGSARASELPEPSAPDFPRVPEGRGPVKRERGSLHLFTVWSGPAANAHQQKGTSQMVPAAGAGVPAPAPSAPPLPSDYMPVQENDDMHPSRCGDSYTQALTEAALEAGETMAFLQAVPSAPTAPPELAIAFARAATTPVLIRLQENDDPSNEIGALPAQ